MHIRNILKPFILLIFAFAGVSLAAGQAGSTPINMGPDPIGFALQNWGGAFSNGAASGLFSDYSDTDTGYEFKGFKGNGSFHATTGTNGHSPGAVESNFDNEINHDGEDQVPEPSTLLLIGSGLAGLWLLNRSYGVKGVTG